LSFFIISAVIRNVSTEVQKHVCLYSTLHPYSFLM
jgi:hypothetical protein